MCRTCRGMINKEFETHPTEDEELNLSDSGFAELLSLASDRTNQMTKTHNDLDAILQLLQEKEKDLELAARIGQSLLERNKQLLQKTQAFEEFVAECGEKETQLQHEVSMKNELLHQFMKDQELEDLYQASHTADEDSRSTSESSCRDDSINILRSKCQALEEQNTHLIFEALQLKEETASVEMKEQQLVLDCVKQLSEAKDQITELTDEISQKAEDNIRQQEEITHLITTVVDLQKRHRQLTQNNEDLQSLLNSSQTNQRQLKTQVNDLQDKYNECLEMLLENQRAVKKLNTKFEDGMQPLKSSLSSLSHYDSRDSIALEIEESVKRDLTSQQEKREHTARVMETVRAINTGKGSNVSKSGGTHGYPQGTTLKEGASHHFTPSPVGMGSSEEGNVSRSHPGFSGVDRRRSSQFGRRSFRAPEKLQIVKPIKGSVTLHKWKKLANPTLNLAENRPGVHVKGEGQEQRHDKQPKEQTDSSDLDPDDYEEDEPLHMRFSGASESTSEVTSQVDTAEEDDGDDADDGPIHMRVSRHNEKGISPARERKARNKKSSAGLSPSNLGLIPLVSGQGFQRGLRERGADSGSILTHLLNSPSSTAPSTSSVGQVLADVLQKASEAASKKEPSRAESLRNLANYFSEKERGASKAAVKANKPDPSSTVGTQTSSPEGGVLLSKILGSSGLTADLAISNPVTKTAKPSSGLLTSSTSSTSAGPNLLTGGRLVRSSSGSNLLILAQEAMSDNSVPKRLSLDSSQLMKNSGNPMELSVTSPSPEMDFSQLKFPTLRRRASSGDLQEMGSSTRLDQLGGNGLGARLYRSSSSGNLKDLSSEGPAGPPEDEGFFGRLRRTPSIGSLTNLVQRSNFSAISSPMETLRQRSSSLEAFPVFKPSNTPPSPSRFDQDSGSFFSRSLSSQNAPSATADTIPGAASGGLLAGTRLSSLAGVRGFWNQRGSKSLESALSPAAREPSSEDRLEKINKAFTFEDFGGLGLMSFFGGKSRGASQ